MNFDKLIKKNTNGSYCVLFKNICAIEKDDIMKIFSKFGKIHSFSSCGDTKSPLFFIRFHEYNSAINAVEGLKCHPNISLLEHTNKSLKKLECNQFKLNLDKKNISNNSEHFAKKDSKFDKNNYRRTPLKNEKDNDDAFIHKKFLKGQNTNDEVLFNNPSSVINKSHRNYSIESTNNINEFQIPTLCTKKKYCEAEEVIVANIHPKYGAPYILHLFDKFDPIAISNIKMVLSTGIRYCHVYFKSIKESEAVEKLFDSVNLLGKKLIVLRLRNLIQEASM